MLLAAPGCSWLRLAAPGCSWTLLAVPGGPWSLLADSGCSWLLLAACGCLWLLLTAPGCSWLLLAGSGCLWLLLAVPPLGVCGLWRSGWLSGLCVCGLWWSGWVAWAVGLGFGSAWGLVGSAWSARRACLFVVFGCLGLLGGWLRWVLAAGLSRAPRATTLGGTADRASSRPVHPSTSASPPPRSPTSAEDCH